MVKDWWRLGAQHGVVNERTKEGVYELRKASLVKGKVAQSSPTLCDPMDYTVRGILQTRILEWMAILISRESQDLNSGLPHYRQIIYQLNQKEWVTYSFSSGSSQPRNQTRVSCIAGRFFTNWTTREAPSVKNPSADIGDKSSIPGSGISPRVGNGNPLQYSCLGKSHGQRSLAG